MKITQDVPERVYPYLAIITFGEPLVEGVKYDISEIMMVSMVSKEGEDCKPYAQHLDGNKEGWFTNHEKDYTRLPNGYKVTIEQ